MLTNHVQTMFKLKDPTTIFYQPAYGQVPKEFRLPVKLTEEPASQIIGEFVYFTTSDTRFVFSLSGRFVFASSLDLMIPVEHINQGPRQSG